MDSIENFKELIAKKEDQENEDLFCPICKGFLRPENTSQTVCMHLFCIDCLDTHMASGNNFLGKNKCPICRHHLSTSKIYPLKDANLFAYNYLSNIEIKCKNPKCEEKIKYSNLKSHLQECQYEPMDCPFCDKKGFLRKDFHQHLKKNKDSHFIQMAEKIIYLEKYLGKKK